MVRALLTLKENKMSTFPTKILLASDSSDTAAHAMDLAVELCEQTGSQLHLVYVGEDAYSSATLISPEAADLEGVAREDPVLIEQLQQQSDQMARRVLDTEVQKVREAGGTVAQAHLRMGKADIEIVELAKEIDAGLLILGSRGSGMIKRALIGSVSDSVVRHAHCPVTVVRQDKDE
jgi:nucleotide-binding universal stress UspA family protein